MEQNLKPDLVDDEIRNRVAQILDSPKEDYWGPAKVAATNVYQSWIKDNWGFLLLMAGLILFLIWRYRYVKRRKKYAKTETAADRIMEAYRKQQEKMHEPKIVL